MRQMEKLDIPEVAAQLIKLHGENAWLEASLQADKAVLEGDEDAVRYWKRVVIEIDSQQAQRRRGSPY